ncbi:MAG: aminotransferase class V-fold PLP-dependent enzyme [Micropepsaceae bacterium]
MSKFGKHLRPLWHLEGDGTFLNHGSFGACPKEVLAAQSNWRETMERQPDQFFRRTVSPLNHNNMLRQGADRLAKFMGTSGDKVAFVSNPTEAVNTVLKAFPLSAGDEILVLDCVYNAVRMSVEEKCRETGARMVKANLPIPVQANDVVGRIVEAATPRTRLAIIDHIASAPALVFPVAEITKALHDKGIKVLIDGAHALGQLDLDLESIGADWYTATAHKWFYSPKGSAFLHARDPLDLKLRPLSVSHYYNDPFPLCFDYVGTRDVTAFLTLPFAQDFIERFGADDIRAWLSQLSRAGVEPLSRIGAAPIAPDSMFAAMRAYALPQKREAHPDDAQELINGFWDRHRIQIAASAYQGKLLVRISAQIYVELDDISHLVDVLAREGWPGR